MSSKLCWKTDQKTKLVLAGLRGESVKPAMKFPKKTSHEDIFLVRFEFYCIYITQAYYFVNSPASIQISNSTGERDI